MTDIGDHVLGFGKHEGQRLDDIPMSYIDWANREAKYLPMEDLLAIQEYCRQDWFDKELEQERAEL